MTTLSALPNELRDSISEYVRRQDLRNVRAASRLWRESASRVLFNRVYLSDHQRDIDGFEAITSNHDLRKHARELVFDISTYNPDLLDFDCFLYLTDHHQPRCVRDDQRNEGHTEDSARIRDWHVNTARECRNDGDMIRRRQIDTVTGFFEWFRKRVHLHIRNRQTNAAFRALRKAILSGWEVERIIITSLPAGSAYENRPDGPFQQPGCSPEAKAWDEKMRDEKMRSPTAPIPWEEIQPRATWMTFDQQLPAILNLANSGNNLDGWLNASMSWQGWRDRVVHGQEERCFHAAPVGSPYRALSMIMRILQETKRFESITALSLIPSRKKHPACCNCGEGMSSAIFLTNGPDMMQLEQLAKQLKVLRLVPEAVTDSDVTHFEYPGLRRLLQHGTKALEELYLEFIHHKNLSTDRHLLRDLTFDKLRKMHLFDVRFTDVELFTFVYKNQHCLRKLIVCYCDMMDENGAMLDGDEDESQPLEATGWWWPVLDELRSMGCFGKMELYIDSVAQQQPTLVMEGEPDLEEGMSRWKTWTVSGAQFPLLGGCPEQDPSLVEMIPANYREQLRSALPKRRE